MPLANLLPLSCTVSGGPFLLLTTNECFKITRMSIRVYSNEIAERNEIKCVDSLSTCR